MALEGSISLEKLAADVRPFIEDDLDDYRVGKILARQFRKTIETVAYTLHKCDVDQAAMYGICRMLDMHEGEMVGLMSVTREGT